MTDLTEKWAGDWLISEDDSDRNLMDNDER